MRRTFLRYSVLPTLLSAILCTRAAAQSTGSIVGRVVDAASGAPLPGVELRIEKLPHRTTSGADGRFVIGGVPAGERELRVSHIGYKPLVLTRVQVRPGHSTEVRVTLDVSPVEVAPLEVRADRERLVEPEVSTTHQAVVGRELREMPVDRIEDVLELTTGVTGGRFRGGRVGQEVYVVDGIELKNQLEASRQGAELELSPSSLEEVDVITGGFGAEYGSALSGVVSYTTRRGNPNKWESRAAFMTDHWAPESIFRGFSGLSVSSGGPLRFLGKGATLYADVLAQGMLDADSRVRGLTCLRPEDAPADLAGEIHELQNDAAGAPLYCPYTSPVIPHQRGDKLIAFGRFDKPLAHSWNVNASLLHNRTQRELYTSEFKYNNDYQLGQRFSGALATLSAEQLVQRASGSTSLSVRTALMRLDRYLGVVDPATWDQLSISGFHPGSFKFIGEDFTRSSIEAQLAAGSAVPGYIAPSGSSNSPFGPVAAGLFYTTGMPTIANWSRSDLLSTDAALARFAADGSVYRAGVNSKLYRVQSYERALANIAGALPNYARFYPATFSTFGEANVETDDGMHFEFGVRAEAFRSGIDFQEDRSKTVAPVISSSWKISVMPRLGVSFPIPGSAGRSAIRFNFGRVSQPPDFRYFLDSTIGDSLRTDIRRQGNPNLSFESGSAYEIGATQLFGEHVSLAFTAFRKSLEHLTSGNLQLGDVGTSGRYATDDFGTVKGLELTLRARWTGVAMRAGWALQRASGLTTGAENDSIISGDAARTEYPLSFDRRHAGDLSVFFGRAAGTSAPWSAVLTATAQSGYPLYRSAQRTGTDTYDYLPWTSNIDLRASWQLGVVPLCAHCTTRLVFDGRNIINRSNILALRRTSALVAPTLAEVRALANSLPVPSEAIPRESPSYSPLVDRNRDGVITVDEAAAARFAAALERYDPTLFFGEARQLRLGVEVTF